jgi:hypothetical protein
MEFALEPGRILPPEEILQEVSDPFLVRVTDVTLPLKTSCPSLPWLPDPFMPDSHALPLAAIAGILGHGSFSSADLQDAPMPSLALIPSSAHRILTHLTSSGLTLQETYNSVDLFISAVRAAAEASGSCPQLQLQREDFFSTQRFQEVAAPAQHPPPQGGRGRGRGRANPNNNNNNQPNNNNNNNNNHALQVAAPAPQPGNDADDSIDYVGHLKIGSLVDATGLLAPLGDLIIATGSYFLTNQRSEGSQFHAIMSDLKAKQPGEVSRDSLLGGLVAHWWSTAMWPAALRNTTFQGLQNQLDVNARARFMDRAQRVSVLTERFTILLQSTPHLKALCGGMLPSEAYALLHPMCKQLVPLSDDASVDQFFELDKVVSQWTQTVSGMLDLTTPRERVQWIVEKVKMLDKANKLLPASNTAKPGARKGPLPIADKVHAALMGQLITSPEFINLWSTIQPQIELIKTGLIEDTLDDTLSQVLGECFANDPEGGPIIWIVQWLVSDLSALPYHLFFTEMLVVRNKKAVYIGCCIARDAAGAPLEGAAGFIVTDDIVTKMDQGQFHLINFYNDLLLPLRSYVNQSKEAAIDPSRLWKETELMREILPIGSNLFQAYGYGSAAKDNSFGSLVEKVISFIQGAATPMKSYHVQKVASNMPRILKAAGETFVEAMHSPPTAIFPSSFLNAITHAAHLEDLRINVEASRQMTTLGRAFPGLMNHLAAAAVDPSTAFIPQTGLVTKYQSSSTKRATSKQAQKTSTPGSSKTYQTSKSGGAGARAGPSQRSMATPYMSGTTAANNKRQKPSTPEDYLGLGAHIVTENQSTVTITSSKPGGKANAYSKTEMARHLKCKAEDKCWAVGVSLKPFPQNLMFCNNKSHRPDDPTHRFPQGFAQLVQSPPFHQP